jgi:tetratricopeptide (TPR) repeat protein
VDAAIATYQRAIEQNPRDLRFYVLAGTLVETKHDWERAKAYYRKALQIQPDYAPAANDLAFLMLQTGDNVDVALALAQSARRNLPESPNVADTIGWAFYRKGTYGLAIEALERALKGAPDNPNVEYHLGLAYNKNNEPQKAKLHLQRALRLDPSLSGNIEVRRVLGQTEKNRSQGS